MLRLKEKLNNFITQKNNNIPILLKEIDDVKNNKYNKNINQINEIKISYNNLDNFEDKKKCR